MSPPLSLGEPVELDERAEWLLERVVRDRVSFDVEPAEDGLVDLSPSCVAALPVEAGGLGEEVDDAPQECEGQVGWDCMPPIIDPTNGTYQYDCGTIGGTLSRIENKTGTLVEGAVDEACQKQALEQGWPIACAVFALAVAYFAIRAW